MKFGEKEQVVLGAYCNLRKTAKDWSLGAGWLSLCEL